MRAPSTNGPDVNGRRILLILGGGIAAYKCLDLIRRLRERGASVRAIMTAAAQQFITPLAVGAISGDRVFTELFDREDEHDIGHIRLSREADLIVVAPATASLLAKMAGGHADDLATAVLLATDKPVLVAPAMNPRMWLHPATRRNIETLRDDGVHFIGPNTGEMAESGEAGPGRMAEPLEIVAAIEEAAPGPKRPAARWKTCDRNERPDPRANRSGPLHCKSLLRKAGARNRASSCRARRARHSGLRPSLYCRSSERRRCPRRDGAGDVGSCRSCPTADIGVFAAAVADWRVASASGQKIKKEKGAAAPSLALVENPDILKTIASRGPMRPALVIGFAAETENVVEFAKKKRKAKGCDWIVANDVSEKGGAMGGDRNAVHLITAQGSESWPVMDKTEVAHKLMERAAQHLRQTQVTV